MEQIFIKVLNMSISASWLILAVIALRFVMRRTPKWMFCLLWGLVALRLACPFSIEAAFSLIPSEEAVNPAVVLQQYQPVLNSEAPVMDHEVHPVIIDPPAANSAASANPVRTRTYIASVVWLVGAGLLLLYALIGYLRLRRKVAEAVPGDQGAWFCDAVETPYILGVVCPRIYLPSSMDQKDMNYVMAHENAHLRRGDQWWKAMGYLLLGMHWFNPLVWLSYALFCKDTELACDERVISAYSMAEKKAYANALLSCSLHRKIVFAYPLSFGEIGVKTRIKTVLNYRKPPFWIVVTGVAACVALAACFLTNPAKPSESGAEPDTAQSSIESAEGDEPSLENRAFIETWANAFADKDARTLIDCSTEEVQKSLEERELLVKGEEYSSFGFSSPWPMWEEASMGYIISYQDDAKLQADIVYYAITSDPHVTAWHEKLSFEKADGKYRVTSEELLYNDDISSRDEYHAAYPHEINGTPMDYTQNGLGEALNSNALLSSSYMYQDLFDPISAARFLLNLSEDEARVRLSAVLDDAPDGSVDVKIEFMQSGDVQMVSMTQPWKDGVWIPQNYGSVEEEGTGAASNGNGIRTMPDSGGMDEEMSEVISRVAGNTGLSDAYAWSNTVEFKENADILIKMAEEPSGRYEAYGIISEEYGSYGILLNDKIGGDDNWNFVYEPWFYTGFENSRPRLMWTKNGNLLFSYPSQASEGNVLEKLCYVLHGYDTGHMELIPFEMEDIVSQAREKVRIDVSESDRIIHVYDAEKDVEIAGLPIPEDVSGEISEELVFHQIQYVQSGDVILMIWKGIDAESEKNPYMGYLTFEVSVNVSGESEVTFSLNHPGTYGGEGGVEDLQ